MSIFSPQFPSQPTPAGATVATTQFPTELAPFIKDVLEKAKSTTNRRNISSIYRTTVSSVY